MTVLKCIRCGHYWTMTTLWPHQYRTIAKFCPDCIPAVYPKMGAVA